MLYVKALHVIAMVAWFAGLFYLPRLYVYHVATNDELSIERFKIMERRLYYGIIWPAAIATTIFGGLLIGYHSSYYLYATWMQAKLVCVGLLWIFHLFCGHYRRQFAQNCIHKSENFFRIFNELPTLLLIAIVILVEVKPLL